MTASSEIEEGTTLQPKFDADGLVTAVATDAATGDVLMVAHMNAEALAKTIASGEAHYFSRSRKTLWRKGEESGHTQRVIELRIDCDQDAVWLKVAQAGAGACHTGRRSCFIARYRSANRARSPSSSANPDGFSTRRQPIAAGHKSVKGSTSGRKTGSTASRLAGWIASPSSRWLRRWKR